MYSILIIEDDASLCSNMELILKMEGFAVRTTDNGEQALDMVRSHRPDLILCDILMPLMDGHTFLDLLKQEDDCAGIPFIFVTALNDRNDLRRGMSAGADDYLTKPFTAEELVTSVTGRLIRLELIRSNSVKEVLKKEQAFLRRQISAREREVLVLVGKGATSREIADQLGISIRTVEVHRSNLLSKLNVANAAMLARWAVIAEQMQP